MDQQHLKDMVRLLKPLLKDTDAALVILQRYWATRMALVWSVQDVYRAANERSVALTEREAVGVLQTLHHQHNPQLGIRWEDITNHIDDRVLGRKMTRSEVSKFVKRDILTIHK